jgi:hypothetical protein
MMTKLYKPTENTIIVLILIWYYRIFGITFGGLIFGKSGEFIINKKLKIFGHFLTLSLIIVYIVFSRILINSEVINHIRDDGFKVTYYLVIFCREVRDILIIICLIYYQCKSSHLFKILTTYPIRKRKNQILIFMSIITQLLFLVICSLYHLGSVDTFISPKNIIFVIILTIYSSIALSAIHCIPLGKIY